jgi:hypothetical protein
MGEVIQQLRISSATVSHFKIYEVASGLRGCGQVTQFGLLLSTPHEGEVLEIVEIKKKMPLPSFVS